MFHGGTPWSFVVQCSSSEPSMLSYAISLKKVCWKRLWNSTPNDHVAYNHPQIKHGYCRQDFKTLENMSKTGFALPNWISGFLDMETKKNNLWYASTNTTKEVEKGHGPGEVVSITAGDRLLPSYVRAYLFFILIWSNNNLQIIVGRSGMASWGIQKLVKRTNFRCWHSGCP